MNQKLFILIFILLSSCKPEEETPIVIYPGIPLNIQYVKLSLSLYTNSYTLIANGKNSLSFFLTFYDAERKVVTHPTSPSIKIIINGTSELSYPFKFSTTQPGTYTFALKGFQESSMLEKVITLKAIADKEVPQIVLPVIFHYIVPPGQPLDNLQYNSLLQSNIEQLNLAFRNKNDSKNSSAVDIGITFKLATKAPDGTLLEVPGLSIVKSEINRFDNKDDPELNKIIWAGNFWSPKKYVNVWICDFEDKFSYGNFPLLNNSTSEFPDYSYGVFFKKSHFISSHTKSIIVHEIGHILNLYHTFDPSCDNDSDNCQDTQYYQRSYADDKPFGLQRTSCSGEKFVGVNYMDYWPNEYNTFTYDQRERIMETINRCPFLPTPKNTGSAGGRVKSLVSNQAMQWSIYPERGTY